ncbi:MAG: hypothetical protein AAF488_00050 [Planctomycetota bacterium]
MDSARKRQVPRWTVIAVVLLCVLGAIGWGSYLVLLQPPIPDTRVEEIIKRIESVAARETTPNSPELLAAFRRLETRVETFLVPYRVQGPNPLLQLADATQPFERSVWESATASAKPILEALDQIPPKGVATSTLALGPSKLVWADLVVILEALSRGRRESGALDTLVELSTQFVRATRLVDRGETRGAHASMLLVFPAAEVMVQGAPHADATALAAAIDALAHREVDLAHLDRVIARKMLEGFDRIARAYPDADTHEPAPGDFPLRETARFIRYQRAVHAKRCVRYFDLPRDAGWADFGAEFNRELIDDVASHSSWKEKLANEVAVFPKSFIDFATQTQEQSVLTRAVLAAELYRRVHDRYPASIEAIAPHAGGALLLPYPGEITLAGSNESCTITATSDSGSRTISLGQ